MATSFHTVKNAFSALPLGTLNADINSSVETIVLSSGEGASFPSAGPFWVSIDSEIIEITSRSTDTLTVTASTGRGSQSTTATSHTAGGGVYLMMTAGALEEIHTAVNGIENGTTTLAALNVSGNVAVNTNKFNITAASGNTAIAGTLGVTGALSANTLALASGTTATLYNTTATTFNGWQAATTWTVGATTGTGTIRTPLTLSSTLAVTGDVTLTGDIAVNGGDITTSASTFNLVNTTAATVNIAGAASTTTLGASGSTLTVGSALNFNGGGSNDIRAFGSRNLVLRLGSTAGSNILDIKDAAYTTQASCTDVGVWTMKGLNCNGTLTMGNANNIVLNTSTGTKIGTGTTQKLAFWNATPIVQPTFIAAPGTPSGDIDNEARDTINSIRTLLINTGLMAAS